MVSSKLNVVLPLILTALLPTQTGVEEATAKTAKTAPQETTLVSVSVSVKNEDARRVIDSIVKQADCNVVVSPDVTGTVTLRLRDVSWFDALTAAGHALGYEVTRTKGDIVRVTTKQSGR